MNYEDIKQEILEAWDEIDGIDGRWMNEAVDSALPIYNSDIIEQWTRMPGEFDGAWKDTGIKAENSTIQELMLVDLYVFTQSEYDKAYREIQAEKEEQEND